MCGHDIVNLMILQMYW